MSKVPFCEAEIERIISQLQSVPGIRTLEFRGGCGFPHITVIKCGCNTNYYFFLAPKKYEPKEGEFDYMFWFPDDRVHVCSTAGEVLKFMHISVAPGTIQEFKKKNYWKEI
jgi:hypothetical protein